MVKEVDIMLGFFNQGSINWYLTSTVLIVFVLLFASIAYKTKRTIIPVATVTPMTMASEEKWKQVHKFNLIIAYTLFVPLLIVNTIFFIIDKQHAYMHTITSIVAIVVIAYFVILIIYTDILERRWLEEQRRKGNPVSDFKYLFPGIQKRRLIIGLVITVAILIVIPILRYLFRF